MARIKIIGDSILKGTLYDEKTGRYIFDNYLREIENSENLSKFGLTVTKGSVYIKKILEKEPVPEYLLMDFGGNDSDYFWEEINASPESEHYNKTPSDSFTKEYVSLINYIRGKGIKPVITTLCIMDGPAYFNRFCSSLRCDRENIMKWLKNINRIEETQNSYSEKVKSIAQSENIPLIDIRSAMLSVCGENKASLLCPDGIHANKAGQEIILSCIKNFFMIH